MAIYEYWCPRCKQVFPLMRPMSQADETAICPECHTEAEKLASVFASTIRGKFCKIIKGPEKEAFRDGLGADKG